MKFSRQKFLKFFFGKKHFDGHSIQQHYKEQICLDETADPNFVFNVKFIIFKHRSLLNFLPSNREKNVLSNKVCLKILLEIVLKLCSHLFKFYVYKNNFLAFFF